MTNTPSNPGEIELFGSYLEHLGPRMHGAGVGIQFHYNQSSPGIHFKVDVCDEYRGAIVSGLKEALAERFPLLPSSTAVWVTRVEEHKVHSSSLAFYRASIMVVEQAYVLSKRRTPPSS